MKGKLFLTLLGILTLLNLYALSLHAESKMAKIGRDGIMTKQGEHKRIKIGQANLEYIFSSLPEFEKISLAYNSFEEQLAVQLSKKLQEYKEKAETFDKGLTTMTEAVKKQKEAELNKLQVNIQKFQLEAQDTIAKKQMELLKPLSKKVDKAIEEVAKENGYTYVFNVGVGEARILLYTEEGTDISDLVLKKLNITPQTNSKNQK